MVEKKTLEKMKSSYLNRLLLVNEPKELIIFQDVFVPEGKKLSMKSNFDKTFDKTLKNARLTLAWCLVGIASRAHERTLLYV